MLKPGLSVAPGQTDYDIYLIVETFMNDNQSDPNLLGSATGADTMALEQQLALYQQHLAELPATASDTDRARVLLDIAETQLALERKEDAWHTVRPALDVFLQHEYWQEAVEACNVLFQTDQPAALSALGQGVWLAVTFPIQPDTTIAMLQHIVDETPEDSDGAAVAAITAHYIADIRSSDEQHQSLTFLTQNILGQVANQPEEFLPRLAKVIDIMVQDDWWFDREALRKKLPVN
jgi:hypothetical protein